MAIKAKVHKVGNIHLLSMDKSSFYQAGQPVRNMLTEGNALSQKLMTN